MNQPPRILVVENESTYRHALVRILSSRYEVIDTASAEHALDFVLNGECFDVVLCDMGLDGWSGGDFYNRLRRRSDRHAARFVMLSGIDVAGRHLALAAELPGRLLRKPVSNDELLAVLAEVKAQAAA